MKYIVIDQRNGKYSIGQKSDTPGVDYVYKEHMGGFSLNMAIQVVKKMNEEQPEPKIHLHD